ncbi:MAG: SAM-dependent chlorinase/fluorinase [Candidatus Omnitrophota bacterium]|nr:SAM-dependent chlorinase/fluorinase [Candidatus Omnitrophota bacterium]
MKPLIALISDFGLRDNFVGVLKAVMLGIAPRARIVDISHGVPRHDIRAAAFLLASSVSYFPRGTVFVSVVDPGVGSGRRAIAMRSRNYYFIGPDNGISSIAAAHDGIKKVVVLENKRYFRKSISSTFHGRDIFAPVAAHLACGVSLERFGRPTIQHHAIGIPAPAIRADMLCGETIHIDVFGNVITNITKKDLVNFIRRKRFKAQLARKKITRLASSYAAAGPGPFFIEGSFGFLEVSMAHKSAARYFSLRGSRGVPVIIRRA